MGPNFTQISLIAFVHKMDEAGIVVWQLNQRFPKHWMLDWSERENGALSGL